MVKLDNNQIVEIFDWQTTNEHFSFLDKYPLLFDEVCEFIVWDIDKECDSFIGSFKKAFEYLKDRGY